MRIDCAVDAVGRSLPSRDAVCFKRRKTHHYGQSMACIPSSGYGSKDMEGANAVAAWILKHVDECGAVLIVNANDSPLDGGWKYED